MFLHLSVSHSVHRGCPGPGPGWSRPRSGGGVFRPRGSVFQHALRQTPPSPSRQLLLRTVRILLECILVCKHFSKIVWFHYNAFMDHLKVEKSWSELFVPARKEWRTKPPPKKHSFIFNCCNQCVISLLKKHHIFALPVFWAFELDGVKKPRTVYRFKFLPPVQILQWR